MHFIDIIKWVKSALAAQKLKAYLTIAGFATGMAAVVLMTSIGDSLKLYVLQQFTQFGSNIIAITPGRSETFGIGGLLKTVRPLTIEDGEQLAKLPNVEYVVPVLAGNAKVKHSNRGRFTDIIGVNSYADSAWKLSLANGNFLPEDASTTPRSFAVLGAKLKQELFGTKAAIGQYVHIGSQRFVVIGVLASKGQFMGFDLDDTVYIPTAIAMRLFNRNSLMELDVFYQGKVDVNVMTKHIKTTLINRHKMEDFTIISQDDMLKSLDKILTIIRIAGSALGLISLIVGAVGIATIMTITVSERTSEIGLLRAVGCSQLQIKQLFLSEAILLAMLSGFLGYLLVVLVLLTSKVFAPNIPIDINFGVFLAAMLASAFIGLLAGYFPARNAANLPPIVALRSS